MSELQTITYQELVNIVKNWIKSNCINITNYGSISAAAKPGYSYTVANVYSYQSAVMAGGRGNPVSHYVAHNEVTKATLTSPVVQATTAQVDSDMTAFLTKIGANSYLTTRVSEVNFYNFITDMVSFCCSKVCFLVSQSGNANNTSLRYLVYNPSQATYNSTVNITSSSSVNAVITASSTLQMVNSLITLIKQGIRVLPCKYTYSITDVAQS